MSIVSVVTVVPSRVAAVFHYLLARANRSESRERLVAVLAPGNLRALVAEPARPGDEAARPLAAGGPSQMIITIVNECIAMGLIEKRGEAGDEIALTQWAMDLYGQGTFSVDAFRRMFIRLITDTNIVRNHDVCQALAWVLAQDPASDINCWTKTEAALHRSFGNQRLGLTNKQNHENLEYWSKFFEMATLTARGSVTYLVPNPTPYLRRILPSLIPEPRAEWLPLTTFLSRLSQECPLFEGGWVHDRIKPHLPARAQGTMPPAIELSLLSLRDEERIRLQRSSDSSSSYVLDSGRSAEQFTHIRRAS